MWAITEDRSKDGITREREERKKARRTFGKAVSRDGVRGAMMADKAGFDSPMGGRGSKSDTRRQMKGKETLWSHRSRTPLASWKTVVSVL